MTPSVNVSDELDVTVEGAADVSYTRRPERRHPTSSGAGDIRRIEP